MREIIFRGKSKNSGRWVYGDLVSNKYHNRQGTHIYEKNDSVSCPSRYQFVRVNTSTVGQYTGLKDKDGTKIFEGDILSISPVSPKYEVKWDNEQQRFCFWNDCWCSGFNAFITNYKIIGNVYDNPKLLGE